ncbi:MAG TPA: hypothetical protein VFI76_08940 [Terrimicrobiaceae bacterium]|nr:hypothetical protein [Terrimicrobiaceae bacterium]
MAKQNRVYTIELRLLDVDDEQHDACRELVTNTARDLHASATLLTGGGSRPKVFHFGAGYNLDIGKIAEEVEGVAQTIMKGDKS